ncbi:SMC-Scp complex subunit ScpB [Ruminococcus sp.]|uniref:SMC-Scp complex subunit ScpB n=1 Tax=Ruminococcus sp. TaxID=41978 RepID=UPI0038666140
MTEKEYRSSIEAILFAAGDPVDGKRLSEALDIPESAVKTQLDILIKEFAEMERGITIIQLNDAYQMVSVKQFAPQVRKAMDLRRNIPLSQAAMEVLAVIAYNQPVTKSFVEQVRGVDCSGVIGSLTTKGLIEEKGRLELPGRPLLYGTTDHFLRCFSIRSLDELPPIPKDEDKGDRGKQLSIFENEQGSENEKDSQPDTTNDDDTVTGTVEEIVAEAVEGK